MRINIPPTAIVRQHIFRGAHLICVAIPPIAPDPVAIATRGQSAWVTHDPGQSWPDRRGCGIASAVLASGGGVVLAFETLGDALACRARLARECAP